MCKHQSAPGAQHKSAVVTKIIADDLLSSQEVCGNIMQGIRWCKSDVHTNTSSLKLSGTVSKIAFNNADTMLAKWFIQNEF